MATNNLSNVTAADDYAANTSTTGTVAPGSTVTGNIETAGDADWFSLNLAAGQTCTIDLAGTGTGALYDPYLRVYNSSGVLIDYDDDSGGGLDAKLIFTPNVAGRYFLGVNSSTYWTTNITGTYSMSVSGAVATTPSDDYAATTQTTGTVTVGSQTTGNIERVGDEDWFRVALVAGNSYTFELRGSDAGGGTLGTGFAEAYLSLYDNRGWFLNSSANGGTGGDPLVSFTATTTGNYYLSASDLMGYGTGTYTVVASTTSSLDDYKAGTQTTGVARPGSSVTGRIESAGDADWFAVDMNAGQSYTINLTSGASPTLYDPYLRLYNSSGVQLNYDDDSGSGLNAQLTFIPASTGRYYLGASSAGAYSTSTGNYTLTVGNPIVNTDDYAATTSTTGALAAGSQASGKIETVGDRDWFRVQLTAGTTYTINLNSGSSLALSDPYLSLYNSAGAWLRSDDDGGSGLNAQITYTPATSGSYFLEARSSGGSYYGTGTYAITLSGSSANLDDYAATTATTGRVAVGATTTGKIEASGDHDWFAVSLVAGTSYSINLNSSSASTSTGLYDPYLRLYTGSGTQVASDDDSGTGLNAQITYRPSVSGTFYIDASSASYFSSVTGSYNLSVTSTGTATTGGTGTTGSTGSTSTGTGTVIPADDYAATTATTGRASVGGTVTGRIETANDQDWFAVTLSAGSSYTIRVNSAAASGLPDPYVRLLNSSGTSLATDDDSGTGMNAQLTYTPTTSGTYYVAASSSPVLASQTGNYELAITATAAPATPVVTPPATASGFNIDVRYTGNSAYQSAFTNAAARWQSIITSDLADVTSPAYGLIDDLLITASVTSIDGVGGVLGRAGPTGLRSGNGLPYLGMMQFDSADMASMAANGTLQNVIIHEMGHVLGIGGLWDYNNLLDPANDARYTGQYALNAWRSLSGNQAATYVPLETMGGLGTAGAHWSENTFGDEMMTGYVDNQMPLSIVTIGTLADLGYSVNYAMADAYSLG